MNSKTYVTLFLGDPLRGGVELPQCANDRAEISDWDVRIVDGEISISNSHAVVVLSPQSCDCQYSHLAIVDKDGAVVAPIHIGTSYAYARESVNIQKGGISIGMVR